MNLPRLSARVGVGLAATLAVAIGVSESRRYVPYRDTGGIWTVCDGITGPDVLAGKRYTDEECDALLDKHLDYHAGRVLQCISEPLNRNEKLAWIHFSYNVGPNNFCGSTAARLLNRGEHKAACDQIERWMYVGGKDCRLAESKCAGIPIRRAKEYAWCVKPDTPNGNNAPQSSPSGGNVPER